MEWFGFEHRDDLGEVGVAEVGAGVGHEGGVNPSWDAVVVDRPVELRVALEEEVVGGWPDEVAALDVNADVLGLSVVGDGDVVSGGFWGIPFSGPEDPSEALVGGPVGVIIAGVKTGSGSLGGSSELGEGGGELGVNWKLWRWDSGLSALLPKRLKVAKVGHVVNGAVEEG